MNFNDIEKDIIKWRRILHENPELSFKEYKTTEFIKEKLLSFGNIEKVVRDSLFVVSSTISTTGFVTVDYNFWPPFLYILYT